MMYAIEEGMGRFWGQDIGTGVGGGVVWCGYLLEHRLEDM